MGVVFTGLFALGLVLFSRTHVATCTSTTSCSATSSASRDPQVETLPPRRRHARRDRRPCAATCCCLLRSRPGAGDRLCRERF